MNETDLDLQGIALVVSRNGAGYGKRRYCRVTGTVAEYQNCLILSVSELSGLKADEAVWVYAELVLCSMAGKNAATRQ
jgi:hypothetical protein